MFTKEPSVGAAFLFLVLTDLKLTDSLPFRLHFLCFRELTPSFRTPIFDIPAVSFVIPAVAKPFRRPTTVVPVLTQGFRASTIVIPAVTAAFRTLTIAIPAVSKPFRKPTIFVPKGIVGFLSMDYGRWGMKLLSNSAESRHWVVTGN